MMAPLLLVAHVVGALSLEPRAMAGCSRPHAVCPPVLMSEWLTLGSCRAQLDVPASHAFDLISDYPRWPEWSPWLSRVELCGHAHDGTATSRWFLNFKGLSFSWTSRIIEMSPPERISWESTAGVRNGGVVQLVPLGEEKCILTISLRYQIPLRLSRAVSTTFLTELISSRLSADLERFRKIAEDEQSKLLMNPVAVTSLRSAEGDVVCDGDDEIIVHNRPRLWRRILRFRRRGRA